MDHARERCRERWPELKPARMADEVRDAILAGRLAAEKPDGLRGGSFPDGLYAWPAEEPDRVYGIVTTDSAFFVRTVMRKGLDG